MDQQQAHNGGQPASAAGNNQQQQQLHINQAGRSPTPAAFASGAENTSGGISLDADSKQQQQQQASQDISFTTGVDSGFDSFGNTADFINLQQTQAGVTDSGVFDPNSDFGQQQSSAAANDGALSFDNQTQASAYLSPNLTDDFSLFPSGSQGEQFNAPLFEQQTSLSPNDLNSMTSPQSQSHHSPTPPNLLQPDSLQPGSAQQSPSFNQNQFSSPHSSHSRNASLGPEAAFLPNQLGDWSQPQFQGHRRSPSEFSDVSSATHSPNLLSSDNFEDPSGHSPLQRASDGSLYHDVLNIESFTIADSGRSPSHSPAISPRITPQQVPDMNQPSFMLAPPGGGFGGVVGYGMQSSSGAFPSLDPTGGSDMPHMAPPSINIDFAPNSKQGLYETSKPRLDQDSLTPPERGRQGRPRSVTDPYQPGAGALGRIPNNASLSPGKDYNSPRSESSRSASPLDRRTSSSRSPRRQSTSSVPSKAIALRSVGSDHQSGTDAGTTKRVQKHPATFQCTLCPKRFTRAYNLRSHLRTHTDERPFVCTVCGKAFARQHDRKRHESLHSGEKKFVCKGDLKAGGQWGCGRRFARADALGRHFRSEAGRICIKPLLDEEMVDRQRQWQEQQMQNMTPQGFTTDPTTGYPVDANGNYVLPAALLAQYPALAQMNWSTMEGGGGIDDDLSGRSSFDASDYDEADDGGYVSGPGTGYGEGGMSQNFGEMGYASDFGGR